MREYQISYSQSLSEDFIREFKDKVFWAWISKCQSLSEDFIREFKDKLNIDKSKLWQYWSVEDKKKYIIDDTPYNVEQDNSGYYVSAYKSTLKGGRSWYKLSMSYEVGNTYTSHCNCNSDDLASHGLSAWTKENALDFHSSGDLYRVKIYLEDLGCIINDDNFKIRCFKQTFMEKI